MSDREYHVIAEATIMGKSASAAHRGPRDRFKGQPQERQHSAAVRRDAGPTAPGERYLFARGIVTEGRDPASRSGSAGLGERSE